MTQQINLYEERLRPRHEIVTARNAGRVALAVLALVSLAAAVAHVDAIRKTEAAVIAQKNFDEAQKGVAALTTKQGEGGVPVSVAAQLDVARAALASRQEIVGALDSGELGNTEGFSKLLAGFARQAQEELWITGLSISAGGNEIEIRGRALDAALLPAYVQALGREPVFQGRRFAALEMRAVDPAATPGAVKAPPTAAALRVADFVLRSENGATETAPRTGDRR